MKKNSNVHKKNKNSKKCGRENDVLQNLLQL